MWLTLAMNGNKIAVISIASDMNCQKRRTIQFLVECKLTMVICDKKVAFYRMKVYHNAGTQREEVSY
jgi:hypothetical protein